MLTLSHVELASDEVDWWPCVEVGVEIVEVGNEVAVAGDSDALVKAKLDLRQQGNTGGEEAEEDGDDGDTCFVSEDGRRICFPNETREPALFVNASERRSAEAASRRESASVLNLDTREAIDTSSLDALLVQSEDCHEHSDLQHRVDEDGTSRICSEIANGRHANRCTKSECYCLG